MDLVCPAASIRHGCGKVGRKTWSDRHRAPRHRGLVIWPDVASVLPLFDQVRAADVDAVVVPGPEHLGPLELNRVMDVADVETVLPRLSFARWSAVRAGR